MSTVDLLASRTSRPGLPAPRPPSSPTTVLTVPWRHLLPAAVVLAMANTYWMVVLRGTAGPAIRTDAPFSAWVRESTVLLPCYLVATLVAAVLVLRRRARSGRPAGGDVLTALLTVTGAGALTGVLTLAASTGWDYVIERGQVVHMAAMRSSCDAECIDFMQHSTGIVQLKAVGYGAVAIVVTDLLLLALLVAFRGGRLPVAHRTLLTTAAVVRSRADQVGVLLAATLIGSAVVHAAVIPEHLEEWPLAGEFFWLLVMAEMVAGVVVLSRGTASGPLTAVACLSFATVLLWAFSRTRGLPFGPEPGEAEAVGVADLAATSLEVASLVLALALLWRADWLRRPAWTAHGRALGLAAVAAVVAVGVAGSTLPYVSAYAPVTPAHATGDGEHAGHDA